MLFVELWISYKQVIKAVFPSVANREQYIYYLIKIHLKQCGCHWHYMAGGKPNYVEKDILSMS